MECIAKYQPQAYWESTTGRFHHGQRIHLVDSATNSAVAQTGWVDWSRPIGPKIARLHVADHKFGILVHPQYHNIPEIDLGTEALDHAIKSATKHFYCTLMVLNVTPAIGIFYRKALEEIRINPTVSKKGDGILQFSIPLDK